MQNNKPYRQEMIDAIYEKIARKDLSFGCGFLCKYGLDKNYIKRIILGDLGKEFLTIYPDYPFPIMKNHPLFDRVRKDCVLKIIGHPVMIGDVIDFIERNSHQEDSVFSGNTLKMGITKEKKIEILNYNLNIFWKEKRKPIEEQSKECIEFIYNLISE